MSSSLERRLRKLEWCLSTVESPRKQALPEWLQASLAAQGWQSMATDALSIGRSSKGDSPTRSPKVFTQRN
jgi:hypothetical protein